MLTPLTNLVGQCGQTKVTKGNGTKKIPWHWDLVHQGAFDKVKATIVQDIVLAYPDYSKPFEIYTDASATQLGAVITQNNRHMACWLKGLSHDGLIAQWHDDKGRWQRHYGMTAQRHYGMMA